MKARWTKQDRANQEHARAMAEANWAEAAHPRIRVQAPWDDELVSRNSVGPTTPPVTVYGPDGVVREVVSAQQMRRRAERAQQQTRVRLTRDRKGRWKSLNQRFV